MSLLGSDVTMRTAPGSQAAEATGIDSKPPQATTTTATTTAKTVTSYVIYLFYFILFLFCCFLAVEYKAWCCVLLYFGCDELFVHTNLIIRD
jgi:hypothetical protein